MMDFNETIRDFIIDRLDEMEDTVTYGCDLARALITYEDREGVYIIGTKRAKDFIVEYFDEADDTWRYFNDNFGIRLNPFENPETYTAYMLEYGVNDALNDLRFVRDNWDDKITLDAPTIGIITAQLDDDESEEAVYYLMKNAYLIENDARFLIEYWADDPLPWAKRYAPYIDTLSPDEDPDEWNRPEGTIIIDEALSAPVIISAEPVKW